ncbi:MAG TPA: hypothetical protein VK171_02095, partial [Fimbriimonas sp.]|nr:hypothetical protein [Fimbriimonas sp.]
SVHIGVFARPSASRLQDIEASDIQVRFASLLSTRQLVNGAFEAYKGTDGIKNSQEVVAFLSIDQDLFDTLSTFSRAELANYFKVSWVELFVGDDGIRFERSPYDECVRSRVRRPDVEKITVDGEEVFLSRRDREALGL